MANEDLTGDLIIRAVGEEKNFPININSASDETSKKVYDVGESIIKSVSLPANTKVKLKLKIDTEFDLCLRMGG
jgi:hypothetical protein